MAYKKFSAGFRQVDTVSVIQPQPLAGLAVLAAVPAKAQNPDAEKRRWMERWHEVRRIIMTKRGLDETRASREASQWLQIEWMNEQREEQIDTSICLHCRQRFTNDNRNPGLPFLNGHHGHAWVHHDCHGAWLEAAEAKARAILESFGIEFYD